MTRTVDGDEGGQMSVLDREAEERSDRAYLDGMHDLCETQRRTIDALRAALDAHEEAAGRRDRACADFAEQARGSVVVVLGLLGPLAEEGSPSEVADVVTRGYRQVGHLRDLVEQYAGRTDFDVVVAQAELVVVPVSDVLADVMDAAFAEIADRPVICTVPPRLEVHTATGRLHHLLLDVVLDAARHTPHSSPIEIEVVPIDKAIALVVSDRRRGFLDATGCSNLARQITASLGGNLQVAEREGGGRIVRVVLPQRRAADPAR
jgi:signal transduction histidine kinase